MNREKVLKILLVLFGFLFAAGVYPIVMYLWQPGNEPPGDTMMLSLYVTLGIFLLWAARNLVPAANYSINISPGKYQLVWRVEKVSPEQAEALLRAMARTFGGDPAATDSTRVLRIPGFKNRKYEREFLVQVEKHTDRVYHLPDFPLPSEPRESDFRPRRQARGSSEPRPLTQSEHDWAYAKRALARGDDPEEIVRRIADYRAEDKHDPLYYARLTVSKAQAESRARGERTPSACTAARDLD